MLIVEFEWPELYGEKLLLASIIRRAAYDIAQYRGSTRLEHRKLWKDAYDWMYREPGPAGFEGPEDELFSFTSICELLNVSPQYIRETTLGMTKENVKRYQMVDHRGWI